MLVLQSLVFGVFISLAVAYARFLWKRRRMYHLAAKLDGPKGLPFIGIAHHLFNLSLTEIFEYLMNEPEKYETPSKFWLGPELVVFANTPDMLQIVLNSPKCLDKSPLYDLFVLKKGLLIVGGEMWKRHRKALNPAFSIGNIKKFIQLFDEKSKIFVKNCEKHIEKKSFDVYGYMSACSLETLLKGNCNYVCDIQSDALNNVYIKNVEKGAKILMDRVKNILYHFEAIYHLSKLYRDEQLYIHEGALKIADEIYEQHQNQLKDKNTFNDSDGYQMEPKNFVDCLLEEKNQFEMDEIKDEINTLVAAGHETSAFVVSCTILMLSMFPEAQQKVFEEIEEVFNKSNYEIDYEKLSKLVYLDMVIKETMRLFPVVPFGTRRSNDEVEIGDKVIPAGTTIVISTYSVQRSKKFWGDDADKFNPERFSPENFKNIHPYAYIPFNGGPRICIGWRYGMMFMKTILTNFLRNFEASTELKFEDLTCKIALSLKLNQKCLISVRKR